MRNFTFCVERNARKVKRKMCAMTTFLSEKSAKQICQGLSVIYSTSAKGENIFNKLVEIFNRPSPPPEVPEAKPTEDTLSGMRQPQTLCLMIHRQYKNIIIDNVGLKFNSPNDGVSCHGLSIVKVEGV